jgi:hypothetical protein
MSLLTGLGSLLGIASNTPAARTGTSSGTSNSTSSGSQAGQTGTSSAGSTSNTYTAPQQSLQNQALGTISNNLTNGINLTPLETSGANTINQQYNSIGQNLNQTLAARGFGQSGAVGEGALQTQLGRAGAIGSMTSNLQGYAIQQQQAQLQDALTGAFTPTGTTGSSTSNTSSLLNQLNNTSGATSGSSTLPGSATAGALSGAYGGLLQSLNLASQPNAPSWSSILGGV